MILMACCRRFLVSCDMTEEYQKNGGNSRLGKELLEMCRIRCIIICRGEIMVAFVRKEIISATQLVRQFSTFLTELSNRTLNKIAIVRNNEMEAVVLPVAEYERLVTSAKQASQKSIKDFFGTLDSESAAQMEKAVKECRKVDLNEW